MAAVLVKPVGFVCVFVCACLSLAVPISALYSR